MKLLVLAFDGLIADTISVRAAAIVETLARHDLVVSIEHVVSALPGRTVHEAMRAVVRPPLVGAPDETLLDVLTIQAQQRCAQRLLQGVAIGPALTDVVRHLQMRGTAVVVRSDSPRRDVEQTLALVGGVGEVRMLRCADDPGGERGATSLERSYSEILRRMATRGDAAQHAAMEVGEEAAATARRFLGHVTAVSAQPWQGLRMLDDLLRQGTFRS